ncbi:unnamed protein product [Brachionus calyciflorus]|uniref:Carboxylesterase type B domain-containing protein n=1 Tax=Brachionus calyciflorus TaxID=104777 RepID=A0A813M642_9BILA|nr:unnamed protein product [Brachionus calyciflorus]
MLIFVILMSILRIETTSIAKCSKYDAREVLLETTSGLLSGSCDFVEVNDPSSLFDRSGNVYSWLSVPYAEPPVGPNRFKPPVEVRQRNETIDATKWPNSCIQLAKNDPSNPKGFQGNDMWKVNSDFSKESEDCLYLNIFIPNEAYHRNDFPGSSEPEKFPIMVFFHGGMTTSGSSSLDIYNPSTLVTATKTIVITVNYRLGIFGFLYLENEFPGNQAILDQNEALRWIKNNAEKFGGDADKITLVGHSGSLASLHLFYQNSWQYFRNMILHSGTPLIDNLQPISIEEANRRAKDILSSIGCLNSNTTDSELAQCAQESVYIDRASLDYLTNLAAPFLPVIDGRVFTESPLDSLRNGNFKKCPIITGFTTDEGTSLTANSGLIQNIKSNQNINHTSLVNYLKEYFKFYPSFPVKSSDLIINSILHEYTKLTSERNEDGILNLLAKPSYFASLSKILGDYLFKCPAYKFVDLLAKQNSQVYVYLFAHRISSTPWPSWYGATYGDDLAFLFAHPLAMRDLDSQISVNPWANPSHRYSTNEKNLNNEILSYWSNFIHFNNPNSEQTAKQWPEYSLLNFDSQNGNMTDPNEAGRYVILRSNGSKIGRSYSLESCQFWNSYLPKLAKENEKTIETLRTHYESVQVPCDVQSVKQPDQGPQSVQKETTNNTNNSIRSKFNFLFLCMMSIVVIFNLF